MIELFQVINSALRQETFVPVQVLTQRENLRPCVREALSTVTDAFFSGSSETRGLKVGVVKMLLALHYATSTRTTFEGMSVSLQLRFLTWIARRLRAMATMGGANRMIRTLKGACHTCRKAGLTNSPDEARTAVGQLTVARRSIWTSEFLIQLSMGGRALPKAPPHLVETAVVKQHLTLAQPSVVPALDYVKSIRKFLSHFHVEPCGYVPVKPSFTSPSASYAFSRREGGRSQEIKDLLEPEFLDCLGPPDEEDCEVAIFPGLGWPWNAINERLGDMGEYLSELPFEMESRSVPISEWGYKTRVVSCSDPVRTHQSESYRRQLLKKLQQLPCCRTSSEEDYNALRCDNRDEGPYQVFSADLQSATDNLSHHIIRAFSDELEVPFELVTGGTIDNCPINTGTLMGIPCSWPILSLAHAWACWAMGIPLRSFHLKGDDLIGLWTSEQIQTYQGGIQLLTGMPINLDKSFVAKDRGLFCERSYRLQNCTLVEAKQNFSVRFMVDSTPSEGGFPYPLKVRQRTWSLVGKVRWRILSTIARHWAGYVPRLGGLAYLPISWGGLEAMPHRFGEAAPSLCRKLASAIHDSKDFRKLRAMLGMAWSRAYPAESAERVTEELIAVLSLQLGLTIEGQLWPSLVRVLDESRDTLGQWAHFTNVPAGHAGYHRYYRMVRRLSKRLASKQVPQHSRLKSWTIQGVRRLVARVQYSPLQTGLLSECREALLTSPALVKFTT